MNTNIDRYSEPHTVMLIFKQTANVKKSTAHDAEIDSHENYYKTLGELAGFIYYGEVMNDKAVCAIIRVSDEVAFETVVENDPALQSGCYYIHQVIPFSDQ